MIEIAYLMVYFLVDIYIQQSIIGFWSSEKMTSDVGEMRLGVGKSLLRKRSAGGGGSGWWPEGGQRMEPHCRYSDLRTNSEQTTPTTLRNEGQQRRSRSDLIPGYLPLVSHENSSVDINSPAS